MNALGHGTNYYPLLYIPRQSRLLTLEGDVRYERAVFLDRDGTIVSDVGYLTSPIELSFLDGAIDGLRLLREHFLILLVTNQSSVGRGFIDITTLNTIHQKLADLLEEKGTGIDAIYSCPHIPENQCDCRKPRPGMILAAKSRLGLDLYRSVVIGDKFSDIIAGQAAEVPIRILIKSHKTEREVPLNGNPTHLVNNLLDASKCILDL